MTAGRGREQVVFRLTGSRPTLALVDAAPNSYDSGPMPSMRPTSWGSA